MKIFFAIGLLVSALVFFGMHTSLASDRLFIVDDFITRSAYELILKPKLEMKGWKTELILSPDVDRLLLSGVIHAGDTVLGIGSNSDLEHCLTILRASSLTSISQSEKGEWSAQWKIVFSNKDEPWKKKPSPRAQREYLSSLGLNDREPINWFLECSPSTEEALSAFPKPEHASNR